MLTPERYKQIGLVVKAWQTKTPGLQGKDVKLKDALDMLVDLAAEVDRLRKPAQGPQGKGHLKPVILDAKGQAVMPAPLDQQFAGERREQWRLDRLDALTSDNPLMPCDPDKWRVFGLRWGLPPPPGGWEQVEIILSVMHGVRMTVAEVPYAAKLVSALWLKKHGLAFPDAKMHIDKDGTLHGVPSAE